MPSLWAHKNEKHPQPVFFLIASAKLRSFFEINRNGGVRVPPPLSSYHPNFQPFPKIIFFKIYFLRVPLPHIHIILSSH